jgi:hypothetical protein
VGDCTVDPLKAELELPATAYRAVEAVNAHFPAEAMNEPPLLWRVAKQKAASCAVPPTTTDRDYCASLDGCVQKSAGRSTPSTRCTRAESLFVMA